ncbi:hypothetical protein XELAEV_18035158mg [Xenopus laevis]|uniref:Uncharacterized protein n=1 Tax=Xenopus laevis TaxID=8355 RepID=A0A974CF91_XENLA|nr:hypothetical protein XELAEV_18035158mg [Xenopus laevis]
MIPFSSVERRRICNARYTNVLDKKYLLQPFWIFPENVPEKTWKCNLVQTSKEAHVLAQPSPLNVDGNFFHLIILQETNNQYGCSEKEN